MDVQNEIRKEWDKWKEEGVITYQSETLTQKQIQHQDQVIYLVHNASRDVYDKNAKSIQKPVNKRCPFCDTSNPELFRTGDGKFRVLGNRFACMQYQSILVPIQHLEVIEANYLANSFDFIKPHANLTFMYNSRNAGGGLKHLNWLMSFHEYPPLKELKGLTFFFKLKNGLEIFARDSPSFMIEWTWDESIKDSNNLLFHLIQYMGYENYNLFIFSNKICFIPREAIEIPNGFDMHKFGGLEMIGYFIMKSKEVLESTKAKVLLSGISQISYSKDKQDKLKAFLHLI